MGKAYGAAGQAGASLHTMVVLQAYQADLLNDLDYDKGLALGQELSVLQAQRLLGLMVAAANIIPLGLLHIRPFQLKSRGFNPLNHPSRFLRVMRHGLRVL